MHKVCVGTDRPHAQTKFLKTEIKQKHFRNNFEIKNRDEIKLKLIFKVERNLKFTFKLIWKFKLNMKVKFIFQIRIIQKNNLPSWATILHYC